MYDQERKGMNEAINDESHGAFLGQLYAECNGPRIRVVVQ